MVNSSVSPGRKNPRSRPHSAKMIAAATHGRWHRRRREVLRVEPGRAEAARRECRVRGNDRGHRSRVRAPAYVLGVRGAPGRRRRPLAGPVAGRPALRPRAARATATGATSSTATGTGRREAIGADLDTRRHPFHVAIENWQHDFNIGSVVRTANAFNAAAVHIVGRRRWNRRGAMVTDRYQHVATMRTSPRWPPGPPAARALPLIGVDNLPGAVPLETYALPRRCVLLFGQEGRAVRGGRAGVRRVVVDRAVRLDPVDQRRRRRRDRHARVDPRARPEGYGPGMTSSGDGPPSE